MLYLYPVISEYLQKRKIYTVSLRIYAQSVSSEIREYEGMSIIVDHDSHWVTLDFKMTFDADRGMCAVQNWAYMHEDTVYIISEYFLWDQFMTML